MINWYSRNLTSPLPCDQSNSAAGYMNKENTWLPESNTPELPSAISKLSNGNIDSRFILFNPFCLQFTSIAHWNWSLVSRWGCCPWCFQRWCISPVATNTVRTWPSIIVMTTTVFQRVRRKILSTRRWSIVASRCPFFSHRTFPSWSHSWVRGISLQLKSPHVC